MGTVVMAVSTATAPELTAEQVQRILVLPLESKSVILSSGPRIFDTNGSPVRIPKLGGPVADPGWTGENGLIPERDVAFDEVLLLPETMQSVKVITRYSNELARQSVVALDAVLQARLVKDVADKIDAAFISGDGNDGGAVLTSPIGLLNMAGTQSMAAVGIPSLDDLHDADGLVLGADVDPTKVRWFMTSRDFVALRKIKDLQNRYQIQPDPTQAGAYVLLGHPVTVTNRVPANGGAGTNESSIVLADFSQIAVARDLAPSVKVLTERYADYDQQAIRVVARYDIGALNAEAVVIMRGVTPPA
jgi:HK97 family phage major capsid protein